MKRYQIKIDPKNAYIYIYNNNKGNKFKFSFRTIILQLRKI